MIQMFIIAFNYGKFHLMGHIALILPSFLIGTVFFQMTGVRCLEILQNLV